MEKSEKTKAFQAEEEEESEEDDNQYLLSIRVNQLLKNRQSKLRGSRRTNGHFESISGLKKSGSIKDITSFECKEPGHYKNECPKLRRKDRPRQKFLIGEKKGLMDTWDDSESLEDDSKEVKENVVLMARTEACDDKTQSESESDSEEVFFYLSRSELESCLSEILEKCQKLQNKYKDLNKSMYLNLKHTVSLRKNSPLRMKKISFLKMTNLPFKVRVLKLGNKFFQKPLWILKMS